jgi:uncharacterized protein (TIGR02145 family)
MKKLSFLLLLILIGCSKDPIGSTEGTFKDSRDMHVYKYVKIGTQTWMAENLAYMPAVSPSSDGSESSVFYYVYNYEGSNISDAKSNGNYISYGVLYNREAAKIACPSGWHLPTDAEWTILENYLGEIPGKKMKSITEWSENGNDDNSCGFNALSGGFRTDTGGFYGLSFYTAFWCSSEDAANTWYRALSSSYDGVHRDNTTLNFGFSVRCIKGQ